MEPTKVTLNQLDDLYSYAVDICREFDTDKLPLITLSELVAAAKINHRKASRKYRKFFKGYNNLLDSIEGVCTESCNRFETNMIPLSHLYTIIDHVKTSFAKGLN